jgi:ADP-heptose:LPS heptosyltransferase
MLKSASLSTLATLERAFTRKPPALTGIRNFLLLQYPQALGSAVHATPLFAALRAVFPEANIAAAAAGYALDILQGNPNLDRLVATPSPLTDMPGAVRALREARFFDGKPCAVLQTAGNERSRIALAALRSGFHTRIGFTVAPQLSAAPLSYDPQLSQIANNLRLVELLGRGKALHKRLESNPGLIEPRVYPSPRDFTAARGLLREQRIDEARPIAVFLTQTSPTQRKSWRAERFRIIAEWLDRDFGMQIVFAGSAAEIAAIERLRTSLSFRAANLAGRTSVPELSALLSVADVALTLDTGPMHLARAVRLPMVVIAPAWSPAIEWLPLGNPRVRILKKADLPAAPKDYIIDEVSVEDVKQSLRELLAAYPPRRFTWRANYV